MEHDAREDPFPAPSKQASGMAGGVATEVTRMDFSDKIMIMICQGGRLGQWVQVPLSASSASTVDMAIPSVSALPATSWTPKTLLGAGGEDRDTLGRLYAAQIASHLFLRNSDEKRTLLLGLGLEHVETAREAFFDMLELVQQVL